MVARRHVGQAFDLTNHVVAEVADEPARQRWEIDELGRVVDRQHRLDRGEDAAITRHVDVLGPVYRHDAVSKDHCQYRIPADEREAAPPLAVLDRFEEEPVIVADELGEGGDGCLEVGEQLGPDGDDRVRRGERAELVSTRTDVHGQAPSGVKKQLCAPVWQAPRPCWVTLNNNVSPSQS